MRIIRPSLLVQRTFCALVYFALACANVGEQPADAVQQPRPDTVVVPTVSTTRASLLSAPPIVLSEEVVFGPYSGPADEQFNTVTHSALAADGSFYVLDGRDYLVRVFDKNGKRVRQFGRKGEGPGEFEYPVLIAVSNDTVVVLESEKMHVFRSDGTLIRDIVFQGLNGRMIFVDFLGAVTTPQGVVVLQQVNMHSMKAAGDVTKTAGTATLDSLVLRILDPVTGTRGAPLAWLAGPPTWLLGRAGWGREPYMAADPQLTAGRDGQLYTTRGDDYRIRIHDADGKPLREIVADVEKTPVTAADFRKHLDAEIARIAARPGSQEAGGELAALLDMLRKDGEKPGHADHRPILGRIIPATDGSLLVERLDLDPRPEETGDSTTWDYIDSEGRIAGRLVAPPRLFPRLLDGMKLYAVVRDENNVPQVTRFTIASPSRSPHR